MRFAFREAFAPAPLRALKDSDRASYIGHCLRRRAAELGELIAATFPPSLRESSDLHEVYGLDVEVFTREQFLDELARERRAGYLEGHEEGEKEARRCVRARLQTHIDDLLGDT